MHQIASLTDVCCHTQRLSVKPQLATAIGLASKQGTQKKLGKQQCRATNRSWYPPQFTLVPSYFRVQSLSVKPQLATNNGLASKQRTQGEMGKQQRT